MVMFFATIAYLLPAPTAFAKVGWRYYLIFIALTAIITPITAWYLPETKGLTLEEIGERFGDEVVIRITNISKTERSYLGEKIRNEEVESDTTRPQSDV
jgi:hypothetical protein